MSVELQTPKLGVDLVDEGHAQLFEIERRIATLCARQTLACDECDAEKQSACENQLRESFEELLATMWEHFRDEEMLMDCLPDEPARAHKYEHAELSKLLSLMAQQSTQGSMLSFHHRLLKTLDLWLRDHIERWDVPLVRQIRRREAMQAGTAAA